MGIMDPIRLVKTAIPKDFPIRVTEILPRLKDGGAFVKFEYDANIDPGELEGTWEPTINPDIDGTNSCHKIP